MSTLERAAGADRAGIASVALLTVATAGLVAVGILWSRPPLIEAWLVLFILAAGIATASIGLLAIGHLLGDEWVDPIRDELESATSTMGFVAALAIPLALELGALYPWARGFANAELPPGREFILEPRLFLMRGAAYLAIWIVLAAMLPRTMADRRLSALALALLAATVSLAATDWIASRDPYWWSSLFGFAVAVSQLVAALSCVLLIAMLRRSATSPEHLSSLERVHLTLALLTLWVWFSQFLIVWMANLPNEVAWYRARLEGWPSALIAIALAALVIAILLLIPSRMRRWRLVIASVLVLIHYAAHMTWLIRPAVAQWQDFIWTDFAILAGIVTVWMLRFAVGLRRRSLSSGGADH